MKLSVIVTTWGCEKWLDDCRKSICAAKEAYDGEVEVIEVCDGGGVAHARNAGIARATGDWLVFVDGDDVVVPAYFAEIGRRAADADLLRFRLVRFRNEFSCSTGDLQKPFPGFWQACAYHRSVVPPEGFSEYSFGEDKLFLLKCLKRSKHIRDADIVVYGYRQHSGSTVWRKVTRRRFVDRMASARDWLKEFATGSVGLGGMEQVAAKRCMAREVLGWAAIELQRLDPRPWPSWYENLDELASMSGSLPVLARTQVLVCRCLRWHWVTRLTVEWPRRVLAHYDA